MRIEFLVEGFQPGREVHGIADHGVFLAARRADIAGDHFAEMNADADLQRPSAGTVNSLHRNQHLAGRGDRAVRGIGGLERRAEQRQKSIA